MIIIFFNIIKKKQRTLDVRAQQLKNFHKMLENGTFRNRTISRERKPQAEPEPEISLSNTKIKQTPVILLLFIFIFLQ